MCKMEVMERTVYSDMVRLESDDSNYVITDEKKNKKEQRGQKHVHDSVLHTLEAERLMP